MNINTALLAIGMPGGPELVIILIVVLLIFGGKKIPELAKGLGRGIREFKKASSDVQDEIDNIDRMDTRTTHQQEQPPKTPESE